MNGRVYTASFKKQAVTAVMDLFSVQVPADEMIEVLSLKIFQTSDFKDAEEEGLTIAIRRQTGSFTVGSANTPARARESDAVTNCTVRERDTTQATGTFEDIELVGWNVRMMEPLIWIPEERCSIFGTSDLVVDLDDAPADSLTISAVLKFRELG